jgi:vancomycin resistance protein YoaR
VVLFFGAWAFDTSAAADGSLRNVELDGRDVGALTEQEVSEQVEAEAADFAATEVVITAGGETYESTTADLGVSVDQAATLQAVLDGGREGSALARPLSWAGSFLSPLEVRTEYQARTDQLALVLASLEGPEGREPVEPTLVASTEGVGIQAGQPGEALDPDEVTEAVLEAARAGEDPITIDVQPVATDPQVSDAEAQAVADQATTATAEPFVATVAGKQATFDVPELRSWVGSHITDDGLALTFDGEKIDASLREKIGSLGDAQPQDARFDLVNGQVQIIPAVIGIACCADDAAVEIADALRGGQRAVELQPIEQEPELTTEEAQALGIKEPVGTTTEWKGQQQVKSFTTYHDCCASRVTNIHTIADAVRGTIVLPGETFSMNATVGQRTAEKGYVEAGAIRNGEHVEEIGGGVSQFATTTFNAAFFAGLPFGEYQAHTEHFDRYPYGREATMGYEHPDLQFTNDTPYGIMIWTSYTDTSVTVTLYSTQHAYGQQTGQSESRSGRCTNVTTQRTITYPDGRTAQDTVRATYRDPGATSC